MEETKVLAGKSFSWLPNWRYKVWRVFVRTDVADTKYEMEAG